MECLSNTDEIAEGAHERLCVLVFFRALADVSA